LRSQGSLLLSLEHLQRLEAWSDAYLGDQAPGYRGLAQIIESLLILVEEFIAMHPQQPTAEPAAASAMPVAANADVATAAPQPLGEPASREEAYRQLLLIAQYLARTEPHSPVPYLIRRGVEWGNKPLSELLNELISADAESRRLWTLLGVL
jgi:type VI secretion system protein ImpA